MTSILKKIKENLFFVFIVVCYAVILVINPQMGVDAVKNSGYYIKEMLFIMPVIFVLTALLDKWIPKQTIIRYLGQGSNLKGIFLSFALGAISAGPVYAAFPICIMLHKKGASIRNIVIILSSWAVIKIPMLINEMKFLGPKFMMIRWVLTIISIVVFSWIASKIIKDEDLPEEIEETKVGVSIDRDACMGCTICVQEYNELFEMNKKKAYIKVNGSKMDMKKLQKAMDCCPVQAITYNKEYNKEYNKD